MQIKSSEQSSKVEQGQPMIPISLAIPIPPTHSGKELTDAMALPFAASLALRGSRVTRRRTATAVLTRVIVEICSLRVALGAVPERRHCYENC